MASEISRDRYIFPHYQFYLERTSPVLFANDRYSY
jgi:hypothetical protein